MYTSIAGIYRNGHVELKELPQNVDEGTPVIVTFLQENEIDLRAHGIEEEDAMELRARFMPFAEDWNAPEMNLYDNYNAVKSSR